MGEPSPAGSARRPPLEPGDTGVRPSLRGRGWDSAVGQRMTVGSSAARAPGLVPRAALMLSPLRA